MLTRHSSVFQVIPWNWECLVNRKVQGKKACWHVILNSYLRNALSKFFYKNRKDLMLFENIFWNRSTWPINSSKEEILLRDSKELFVQRFVKVFDQNWKQVEPQNLRTGTQLNLLHRGETVRSSHWKCRIRKPFLNILQYPQETSVLEAIFRKVVDL